MNIHVIGGAVNLALIGATASALLWAQEKFVAAEDFHNLQWSVMKRDIRELRKAIEHSEDEEEIEYLMEDLEELLDMFCLEFPEDRECRSRG